MKAPHQLINQTSGKTDFGTPSFIIEAAREVMGTIDLDPASSEKWNAVVRAARFFSEEDDGLSQFWKADHVWMNHPFGKPENVCGANCRKKSCIKRGWHRKKYLPGNDDWVSKLLEEYRMANVGEACCITFASTSEGWFQKLAWFPQCFLKPRTNFVDERGKLLKGVSKGSAVTYLGRNVARFVEVFKGLGIIKVPYDGQ